MLIESKWKKLNEIKRNDQSSKRIIKERKVNKKLWTKEDVQKESSKAKLIKKRAKKKLEEKKHLTNS